MIFFLMKSDSCENGYLICFAGEVAGQNMVSYSILTNIEKKSVLSFMRISEIAQSPKQFFL